LKEIMTKPFEELYSNLAEAHICRNCDNEDRELKPPVIHFIYMTEWVAVFVNNKRIHCHDRLDGEAMLDLLGILCTSEELENLVPNHIDRNILVESIPNTLTEFRSEVAELAKAQKRERLQQIEAEAADLRREIGDE
jgi:hypothetical protein